MIASISNRFGLNAKETERFLKFAVVGSIGFIVDFGILTLLIEVFGFPTLVANTFSFSAAVVSNFLLNRYWTYPDSRSKSLGKQLVQFIAVNLVGWGINTLILKLAEAPFDKLLALTGVEVFLGRGYLPAKMTATVVVLFWNFFVNRYWTYNDVK